VETPVFPANGLRWHRVSRGTTLTVPVPAHFRTIGSWHLCFYPSASTQPDDMGVPDHSSLQWRRLYVEDIDHGVTLPLWVRTTADAVLVAEAYTTEIDRFRLNPQHGLNPADWEAVSRWTLALAAKHRGRIAVIRDRLFPGGPPGPPPNGQAPPALA
jgi:hypothetical protein